MKIQSIRGFNDVVPADAPVWQFLFDTAREVIESYGYREMRIPLVESTALFKRAVGEVTDVVEKEMYTFKDREGEMLSLRPEFTAGCVRAGIERGLLHNQQQRIWCSGPVFRHERPQHGRYRQFNQLNVEAYGIPGPDVDAELIGMSARLWKRLGLGENVRLEVNSLGGPDARNGHRAALVEFLSRHEASLDEDSRRRLATNPLRVLDSKVPATQEIVRDAPSLADFLEPESRAHFETLQQRLGDLGIAFEVNPRLVRGLDYYTRTVFEWITTDLGAQGTICAGGRYDRLVEQLGGSPTPAVGWASGVERLILLLQKRPPTYDTAEADVYVCCFGTEGERAGLKVAEEARDALAGRAKVSLNVGGGKPGAQFKRADRSGARIALVIGDDEAVAGQVQVKFLRTEQTQTAVARPELGTLLASLFPPNS